MIRPRLELETFSEPNIVGMLD